jgi:uncharacterized integral membrane protein
MDKDISTNQSEKNPKRQTATETLPPTTSKTRISSAWFMVVSFIIVLVLLLIFILQNLRDTAIQFFGFHWKIPLGVAMLLAAVVGGFLVGLFGTARVIQLGHRLRRNKS